MTELDATQVIPWATALAALIVPSDDLGEAGLSEDDACRAAADLQRSTEVVQADPLDADGLCRLAVALNEVGQVLLDTGEADLSMACHAAVYFLLSSAYPNRSDQPDDVKGSINHAFRNLKEQGVNDFASALPAFEAGELPMLTAAGALATTNESAVPSASGGATSAAGAIGNRRATNFTKESMYGSLNEMLVAASSDWSNTDKDAADLLADLRKYVRDQLAPTALLSRDLGELLDADLEEVGKLLAKHGMPSTPDDVHELAKRARRHAQQASRGEASKSVGPEFRLRALLPAVANLALWRMPRGLGSNEFQLRSDVLAYLAAIEIESRYSDVDRDRLLDCAEAIVRVGSEVNPVMLRKHRHLQSWIASAAGTYLLLAGPEPSTPADSYADERVYVGDTDERLQRTRWPKALLDLWRGDEHREAGAAIALASLGGWDETRTSWLLSLILEDEDLSITYWKERVGGLLSRVANVRIIANPWSTKAGTHARDSAIAEDQTGALLVPDVIVKAAAAAGIATDSRIGVNGAPFAGRRVPTFLLTNRFGPYAVLKLDRADKVGREVGQYQLHARRLHQSHRPSECLAASPDFYVGEGGDAVRAIETSYVFERDEAPQTLSNWFPGDTPEQTVRAVDDLLLQVLRPWIAHVRRDRVDLRMDYPVFRPTPAVGRQSPEVTAAKELSRLEASSVAEDLSVELSRHASRLALTEIGDGAERVNPVWLAAQIAEDPTLEKRELDLYETGLYDFDTLLAICHGDLHLENVLCAGVAHRETPRLVLIDFESAHEGHVCKDFARLESSVLLHLEFASGTKSSAILDWFRSSIRIGQGLAATPTTEECSGDVLQVIEAVNAIRRAVAGCGQLHWPLSEDEYLLALLGNLLPMVRWTTLDRDRRLMALALSALVADELASLWGIAGA